MRGCTLGLSLVDGASQRHHGLGEGVLGHERHTPKKQEKVKQLLLYDEVKDKYGCAMGELRVCDLTYV